MRFVLPRVMLRAGRAGRRIGGAGRSPKARRGADAAFKDDTMDRGEQVFNRIQMEKAKRYRRRKQKRVRFHTDPYGPNSI